MGRISSHLIGAWFRSARLPRGQVLHRSLTLGFDLGAVTG